MSIRVRHRRAVLAAAFLATLISLTSCGASSEPAGQLSETGAESSPAAASEPTASNSASAPGEEPDAGITDGASDGASDGANDEPGVDDNDPALCDAADLRGSIEELRGGAAAGSVYRGLALTNTSDRECVLLGYPGVSYVERGEDTPIGAPAVRGDSHDAVSIDLAPGETAMATLKQTNAQNYQDQCEPVQADGLLVYPPSAYDSLFVEQDILACANEAIELMRIEAFQPAE